MGRTASVAAMRLILHAGTHKTGTSTVQRALDEGREWLRGQGLYYPDARPHFAGEHRAHHPWAHSVADQGPDAAAAQDFARSVAGALRADETALLSAEPVYRHVLRDLPGSWWDRHRAYLDAVAANLSPFRVEPLLVFRRRDRFLESVYHERVSQGYAHEFAHLVERSDRLVDYERQTGLFEAVFGTVHVGSYEHLTEMGLLDGFFAMVGAAPPTPPDEAWERRSPDARLVVWMARRNREADTPELVTQRRRFAKHPDTRNLFDDFGATTLWTDDGRRRELLRAYGDDAPVADDRAPAVLDHDTEAMIDRTFSAYLEDKGLPELAELAMSSAPRN